MGDVYIIPTYSRAEIGGLTVVPAPGGGITVSATAHTQRVFALRADLLGPAGALVARDTLDAPWASSAPQPVTGTLFRGTSPSGTYRLRLTPLGRCSYTDWCPLDADAVTSDPFVHVASEPSPSVRLVTLRLAGAHPARETLALELSLASPAEVTVVLYDALGRAVRAHTGPHPAGASALALDVRGLAPGVYVVRAASASGAGATQRVVVAARD